MTDLNSLEGCLSRCEEIEKKGTRVSCCSDDAGGVSNDVIMFGESRPFLGNLKLHWSGTVASPELFI